MCHQSLFEWSHLQGACGHLLVCLFQGEHWKVLWGNITNCRRTRYVCTVRTKKTFTLRAKCAGISIELGALFDRFSHKVHAKWHEEGSELLRNFDSTSIKLHTKWHRN